MAALTPDLYKEGEFDDRPLNCGSRTVRIRADAPKLAVNRQLQGLSCQNQARHGWHGKTIDGQAVLC
jgi:hypothetical protein